MALGLLEGHDRRRLEAYAEQLDAEAAELERRLT